jgi:hypothetical protein
MNTTRRFWIWRVAILSVALLSKDATACSCIAPPPPREAAAEADVVFVGTVVAIREERDSGDGWLMRWFKEYVGRDVDRGYWRYAVEFQVSTVIKGEPPGGKVIRTNTTSPACGYSFREAVEYLVYAYSRKGKTYTSLCTRTTPTERAKDEIQELLNDRGRPSNTGLNLGVRPAG